jgi:hypothetical protein
VGKCGIFTCAISAVNTAACLAALAYVNVNFGSQKMPKYYKDWDTVNFSHEYYVCSAFPRMVRQSDDLYGFPVCNHAVSNKDVVDGDRTNSFSEGC